MRKVLLATLVALVGCGQDGQSFVPTVSFNIVQSQPQPTASPDDWDNPDATGAYADAKEVTP